MDEIKTITILPVDEFRVIKQIKIISEFANNREYSIGYILYERRLTNDYSFKEVSKENNDFLYNLECPRQDSYPNDSVDEIILQSIRNSFPKSTARNYSLISTVDTENIKILQNRHIEQSEITFSPDFSQIDIYKHVGKSFSGLRKSVKIYSNFTKENIQNLYFQGYYNLEDTEILDQINDHIKFI